MFCVYHITSTVTIKHFDTAAGAKRSATCMNRNAGSSQYAWSSVEDYDASVVKTIKVRNLMTGKEVEINSNTPWSCRPDSESYWSN